MRDKADAFGYDLWLPEEPTVSEVLGAVGAAEKYEEIIFCGFGEPTVRLPELLEVARYLKSLGKKVRLNTNGLADRLWNRPVARELAGLVDAVSISLNAGDREKYQQRCLSDFRESAFDSVLAFARDCVSLIPEVTLSVVGLLPDEELESCAALARDMGAGFRVRTLV